MTLELGSSLCSFIGLINGNNYIVISNFLMWMLAFKVMFFPSRLKHNCYICDQMLRAISIGNLENWSQVHGNCLAIESLFVKLKTINFASCKLERCDRSKIHSRSGYLKRTIIYAKICTNIIFNYHKDSKFCLFVPNFRCFLNITFKWNEWHKKIKYLTRKGCSFLSLNIKV